MVVNTTLFVAVLLLGAATGVLLKRSQWAAFEERLRKDFAEQTDSTLRVGPVLEAATHSDLLPDSPVRTLLKKKEMEIALIRSDIQALRTVIPLLEEQPEEHGCQSDKNQAFHLKYATWLSPHR